MLPNFIMFRLHIECSVVEFCGWMLILPIVETLSEDIEMRKIAVLGLLVVLCSGCGRGWLPGRGGRCGPACGQQLPPPPTSEPCSTCGPATASASYGAYDETIVDSGYYGGEVLSNEYYPGAASNGMLVEPTMVAPNPSMAQ